ncbi:hypothetical protein PIB30_031250 [Stylosanthes scabra]|uniref:Secreted protein n=1 Tax=Stylosanthes scabra TaxID=79078 RepID=A0ABU6WBQ1_9FABA|nr:hypothetical protein [Stylosanthes scabra]
MNALTIIFLLFSEIRLPFIIGPCRFRRVPSSPSSSPRHHPREVDRSPVSSRLLNSAMSSEVFFELESRGGDFEQCQRIILFLFSETQLHHQCPNHYFLIILCDTTSLRHRAVSLPESAIIAEQQSAPSSPRSRSQPSLVSSPELSHVFRGFLCMGKKGKPWSNSRVASV